MPVYRGDGKDAVAIASQAIQGLVTTSMTWCDTAGVDEEMMEEAVIKRAGKPDQILMVVDAMTGQDIVNVEDYLRRARGHDGVIMSKRWRCSCGGGATTASLSSLFPWARNPIHLRFFHQIVWPSASLAWAMLSHPSEGPTGGR